MQVRALWCTLCVCVYECECERIMCGRARPCSVKGVASSCYGALDNSTPKKNGLLSRQNENTTDTSMQDSKTKKNKKIKLN